MSGTVQGPERDDLRTCLLLVVYPGLGAGEGGVSAVSTGSVAGEDTAG